ncbi:hypothetical protein GGQ85_001899 [Nitrobacter vulgaris]|nr:hypothetical protein [Nitrobacter vulgaris]
MAGLVPAIHVFDDWTKQHGPKHQAPASRLEDSKNHNKQSELERFA